MIEFVSIPTGTERSQIFVFRHGQSLKYTVRTLNNSGQLALYHNEGYGSYRYTRRSGWVLLSKDVVDQDFFTWDEIYNIVAFEIL